MRHSTKPFAALFLAVLAFAMPWWGCASTKSGAKEQETETVQPSSKGAPVDTAIFEETAVFTYPAVVVNRTINLRKGPGTNYDIAGKLSGGQTVTVVATSGEWVKVLVDRDNQMGWVHRSLVRRKK
ncbi:MAG: hypothetical protein A3F84_27045 [Candidatus Handelsmanbacteria bacterium RIFCSPLOWO2_12_FULL_64_10]|uniref:SH3b domain-containing protein n=1 Tax=Handelsmanbacteria sp. (strain RIFCSPLOWO2_12_FULL_64_10) TaxID=1817868 RepID=A0A1F6C878_HANXR|nr:MAG: hypothetical protein A3F84_27045 [Candidatus Handelsmanbacteria bacterium RIFCSPLOWO2_12_FULL_64_10]